MISRRKRGQKVTYQNLKMLAIRIQRPVILHDLRNMQKIGVDDHDLVAVQFLKWEKKQICDVGKLILHRGWFSKKRQKKNQYNVQT